MGGGAGLPALATSPLCPQGCLCALLTQNRPGNGEWVCCARVWLQACVCTCTLTTHTHTRLVSSPTKGGLELSGKCLYWAPPTAHSPTEVCSWMGFTVFRVAQPPPQSNSGCFHRPERKSAPRGTAPRVPPNPPPAGPPGAAAAVGVCLPRAPCTSGVQHSAVSLPPQCARGAAPPSEAECDLPPCGRPRCVCPSSVRDVGGVHGSAVVHRAAVSLCLQVPGRTHVPFSWGAPGGGAAGSHGPVGPCGPGGCRLISSVAAPADTPTPRAVGGV